MGPTKDSLGLAPVRTYRLGALHRAVFFIAGTGLPLAGLLLVVGGTVMLAAAAMGRLPFRVDDETLRFLVVAVLLMSPALFVFWARAAWTPLAIVLDEAQRAVGFRGVWRTRIVPVSDILSVTTGGWRDPHCSMVAIVLKNGKLRIDNNFGDFRDFLFHLKALNPAVEVKGF